MAKPTDPEEVLPSTQGPIHGDSESSRSEARDAEDKPRARSSHSEARAAVYGLLGAIIGGLATFGGAFWTGHQSQSAADITARRGAYIEFTAAVDQYRQDMVRLEDSLRQGGKSYDHERSRLDAELPTLFRAATLVKLIGKWPVDQDAVLTSNCLIDFDVPVNPKSVNHNQLTLAIQKSKDGLQIFLDDATREFNPQANSYAGGRSLGCQS